MYRLNGANGDRIGLGFTVKVMSGDNVSIFGKSFWHSNGTTNNSYPVTAVLNSLLNTFGGSTAVAAGSHSLASGSVINANSITTGSVSNWLTNNVPTPTNKPKAYINWILFDEQFKVVADGSSYDAVNDNADNIKSHNRTVSISRNGYLYVYCSNESNQDVFFDNLQVIHTRGPLLEETHYYPFGLTMSGISSKAAGKLENKIKFQKQEFQHNEFSDGSGLDMYEFKYRFDDPQTGRFWSIDPLAEKYVYNSTYAFSENKVTSHVELEGLESESINNPYIMAALQQNVQNDVMRLNQHVSNAAGVTFSVGFGVGGSLKVGPVKLGGTASGPQASLSVTSGGKVSAQGSLVGVDGNIQIGSVKVKGGGSAGVVEVKDGKANVSATTAGGNASMSMSKEVKDGNASESITGSSTGAEISAKLGALGATVKADFMEAAKAVAGVFKTVIDYTSNVVKDTYKNFAPSTKGQNSQQH